MDINSPVVSIVMPVFNAAEYLHATVESVLSQSFKKWELVAVLDPKSQDESEAILRTWKAKDARIRILFSDSPGPSEARNLGIEM